MDKFRSYFAFTVSAVGLSVLGLATAGLSFAGETAAPPSHQVTICHATHSATNPYVTITVDVSSAGEAQSLRGHREHSDDVIPTFVYDGVTYPGQNDQSVLAGGCNVSQTTSTQSTAAETTTAPTESTTTGQTTTVVTTQETTTTQNTTTADATVNTSGTTTTTTQSLPTPSGGQRGDTTDVTTTSASSSTAPAATTTSAPFTPPAEKGPSVTRRDRVHPDKITRTSSRLPFTGAPLWQFALAGALLLSGGLLLRTRKK